MSAPSEFQRLLDVVAYGMEFQRGFGDSPMYMSGVVETTGFIASCLIVQRFGYTPGIGAGDVVDALKLHELPKRKKTEKRMRRLFDALGIDTQEGAAK